MTTISLIATDQLLAVALKPKIASGDQNSVELHVDFDSMWDGYGKSAVFYTSDDPDTIYEIPLTNGSCGIPHEVLTKPGVLYIGVRGVNSDNNAVKTSSLVKYKIVEGAPAGDGTTVDPTSDVYQQLLTAYGKTDARMNELIAMRGVSGLKEYNTTFDENHILQIISNGTSATLTVSLGVLTEYPYEYILTDIPTEFSPIKPGVVLVDNSDAYIIFGEKDGVVQLNIQIYNHLAGHKVYVDSYALRNPYIDELGDIRIGYDGTAYETAGEAVREQINAVRAEIGSGGGGSSTGDTHSIKKLELICPENDIGSTSVYLTGIDNVAVENGETFAPALLLNSNNRDVVVIRGVHPGEDDEDAVNKKQMDDAIADILGGKSYELPYIGTGTKKIVLSEQGKLINGTTNLTDLLGITNGTHTKNGVTVTVTDGNTLTITGTATADANFMLTDGSAFGKDWLDREYIMPYGTSRIIWEHVSGSTAVQLYVRGSKVGRVWAYGSSDNGKITPDDTYRSLYAYMPKNKTYNEVYKITLTLPDIEDISDVTNTVVTDNFTSGDVESNGLITATVPGQVVDQYNLQEIIDLINSKADDISIEQTVGMSTSSLMSQKAVTETVMASFDKDEKCIKMYFKYGNRFIEYQLIKTDNSEINAYGWRIGQCFLCNEDKTHITYITTNTEWDMAIKPNGAPDFIGMGSHGDEMMDKFYLRIDGKNVDENAVLSGVFNKIQLYCGTTMYNPIDNVSVVGYHRKLITIKADGTINLENRVEFTTDITMDKSYLAMLPIRRNNDDVQITNEIIDNLDFIPTDCTTTDFIPNADNGGVGASKHGVTRYDIYGDNLGIYAYTEVKRKSPNLDSSFSVISKTTSYNKVYEGFCGDGTSVSAGDVWIQETEMKIGCHCDI